MLVDHNLITEVKMISSGKTIVVFVVWEQRKHGSSGIQKKSNKMSILLAQNGS